VHNEFLVLNKGKMSKSAGGFLTLQSLLDDGFEALDYRFFLLGAHYRSQLQFSFDALKGARSSRASLLDRLRTLALQVPLVQQVPLAGKTERAAGQLTGKAAQYLVAFDAAIDDDLSTPRALAEVWGILRDNTVAPADALAAVFKMDRVLGLGLEEAVVKQSSADAVDGAFAAEIEGLIVERAEAKKTKQFARADEIRNQLKERGILLEDSKDGTTWKKA
jgi:cysteinyl-tRNA synthetase